MHRIDDPSAVSALPTPLQQGTPGYFTDGSPTIGEDATIVRADWANAVQEEISNVIESSGLVLSKTDRTQLLQALARLTRQRLTAPITFYVSPAGNDANDGLTQGTAFASITHAYNYIRDRIDLNGFQSYIQLADGLYSTGVCQFPCIGPAPVIQGDLADASKVTVNGVSNPAIVAAGGAVIYVKNFTVTATGPGGDYGAIGAGLYAGAATIIHQNMNFGACTDSHIFAQSSGGITVGQTNALYNIVGGALRHVYSGSGGYVAFADAHINLAGTPAFSESFVTATRGGSVDCWGAVFTGGATGTRYLVTANGIIDTGGGGPNYFPGNAAGVQNSGGEYV